MLEAAGKLECDDGTRCGTLLILIPSLPAELLASALEAAKNFHDTTMRLRIIAALAPRLPASLLTRAFAMAQPIGDEAERREALSALIRHLPLDEAGKAFAGALDAALAASDPAARSKGLFTLAQTQDLAEEMRGAALLQALEAAKSTVKCGARLQALADLAPHLPPEQWSGAFIEALHALAQFDFSDYWAAMEALAAVRPHLSQDLLDESFYALQAALPGLYEAVRRRHADEGYGNPLKQAPLSLIALKIELFASRLSVNEQMALFAEAIEMAAAIGEDFDAYDTLARSLIKAAPGIRADVFAAAAVSLARKVLITMRDDGNASCIYPALSTLAPYLPKDLLFEVVTTVDVYNYTALSDLAPYLDKEALMASFAAAKAIAFPTARTGALTALAPWLPSAERDEAVAFALEAARLDDKGKPVWGSELSKALTGVARHLPQDEREKALAEALKAAWHTRGYSDHYRQALEDLAPELRDAPSELRAAAVHAALTIEGRFECFSALAALARHLPEDERAQPLAKAITLSKSLGKDKGGFSGLEKDSLARLLNIAPDTPRELWGEFMTALLGSGFLSRTSPGSQGSKRDGADDRRTGRRGRDGRSTPRNRRCETLEAVMAICGDRPHAVEQKNGNSPAARSSRAQRLQKRQNGLLSGNLNDGQSCRSSVGPIDGANSCCMTVAAAWWRFLLLRLWILLRRQLATCRIANKIIAIAWRRSFPRSSSPLHCRLRSIFRRVR